MMSMSNILAQNSGSNWQLKMWPQFYHDVFGPEKGTLKPKNAYFWIVYPDKSICPYNISRQINSCDFYKDDQCVVEFEITISDKTTS